MNRDDLWQQLNHAISLRSAEDQVIWTIFGVFWAANALLLVALFQNGKIPMPSIGMVISGVGALLSFVWYQIQRRALGYLYMFEGIVERLERKLEIPAEFATSGKINQEDYKKLIKGIRTRWLMTTCSLVAAILWALAFLFFFVKLVCCST